MISSLPNKSKTLVLIVDIQEKLCPTMDPLWLNRVLKQNGLLLEYAKRENIPVIVSEQYPKGLGPTHQDVLKELAQVSFQKFEKTHFGCFDDPALRSALESYKDHHIIVTGMETHICVLLTTLGLLKNNQKVIIPHDAVIARSKENHNNGLEQAGIAGATISNVESLLFAMMGQSGGETFKAISNRIKTN
ncbi:MAG: isochorismatase family protein [Deltaproteobacteria bacterium]|nr:isochorismatase family protein [Deltaproteobacteria bacterium]